MYTYVNGYKITEKALAVSDDSCQLIIRLRLT